MPHSLKSKIDIIRTDIITKGLYYSLVDRGKKIPFFTFFYDALKPAKVTIRDAVFFIDKKDSVISESLIKYGVWEPVQTNLLMSLVKKGDTVLDIGAHIGYYSILLGKKVGGSGKVYSFEPDPTSFSYLEKNIAVNKLSNIIPLSSAVSDSTKPLKLYLHPANRGDHRIFDSNDNRQSVTVPSVKLDSYFSEPEKIDLMKIDIQGSEVKALRGMKQLLKRNPQCLLVIEFWPEGLQKAGSNLEEFLSILSGLNYRYSMIDEANRQIQHLTEKELLRMAAKGEVYDTNLLCYTNKNFTLPRQRLSSSE